MDQVAGIRFGRYEVVRSIAEGGMGQVYLCVRHGAGGFEKRVVLKILHSKCLDDPNLVSMFLDEARILARLRHPNVVDVFEVECVEGVPFLAMEYVDGPTLNSLHRAALKANRNPLAPYLHLLRQVCDGLHAAHTLAVDGVPLGIVHRDISTQNVLIDATTGSAKLIDFGIAHLTDALHDRTREGVLKGKLHYVSPEVQAGAPFDARADVYAVGVLLYRCAVGRMPYREADLATPDRPSPYLPIEKVASVPPSVAAIVNQAMAFRPEDRYASAGELSADLKRVVDRLGFDPDQIGPWIQSLFPKRDEDWSRIGESQTGSLHTSLHRLVVDRRSPHDQQLKAMRAATVGTTAFSMVALAGLAIATAGTWWGEASRINDQALTYLDAADELLSAGLPDRAAELNRRAVALGPHDADLVARAAHQRDVIEGRGD